MVKRLPTTITGEEFTKLVKGISNKKYKLAYILGFIQGFRISEIVGLKKEISSCCRANIDYGRVDKRVTRTCSKCKKDVGLKEIRRSAKEWKIEPLMPNQVDKERGFLRIYGKGSKEFDVPLMPPTAKALRTGINLLPLKLSARSLQRQIKLDSEKILGKPIKFHDLRHSSATFYLNEKKLDIIFVQQLLRHSRLDTTQIYTHVNPQQLKARFDELWD